MTGTSPSLTLAALAGFALLAALSLLTACGGAADDDEQAGSDAPSTGSPTTTATTAPTASTSPGRFAVEVRSETFVDPSRSTPDGQGGTLAPERTLVTDIYVPEGPGPFPLVVFAHGRSGHPSKLSSLFGAWAENGYLVAAPAFPVTNDRADRLVVGDYTQQPGDLSFVIDEMLRLAQPGGTLAGKVDAERIGAAGHSLGGGTVWGLTFNTCCRDRRVATVIVLSALQFPFDGGFLTEGPPLLLVHGTDDDSLPYLKGVEPYQAITTPKMLLTLVGGTHSEPFENEPSPHDEVVESVTLDWWAAYLRDDEDARRRLATDSVVDSLTTADLAL